MAKTKKRADGLIERCRVIDGKTRHFYGRTAKEVQAKLDELQRRFDERAAALGRTRKSLLRGNPTARSERYTEVLERLKKRLDTHTHR